MLAIPINLVQAKMPTYPSWMITWKLLGSQEPRLIICACSASEIIFFMMAQDERDWHNILIYCKTNLPTVYLPTLPSTCQGHRAPTLYIPNYFVHSTLEMADIHRRPMVPTQEGIKKLLCNKFAFSCSCNEKIHRRNRSRELTARTDRVLGADRSQREYQLAG